MANYRHESSFSSSRRSNICFNNDNNNNNNNETSTKRLSSSPSEISSTSSCYPYNTFGSKLCSNQQQQQQQQYNFAHLQSLFTNNSSRKINSPVLGRLKSRLMATLARNFPTSPVENNRKKKPNGKQKKEELEREVSMLQNMLKQEEKVHQVLQHVHSLHNGSVITIPNFLPPKTKELLAELAMVEGEISRLEGQIGQLRLGLKKEQESTKESRAKQWRYGSPIRSVCNQSSFTFPSPVSNNSSSARNDSIGFETKTMHFISKAIKGNYNTNHNEQHGPKENNLNDERLPRKNGSFKSVSPLRDPRYSSPRPIRNPGSPLDSPAKPVSMTFVEESVQNWQPNKLSEEIMKCLNFIYIRLLRTTRAMELERSGPVARGSLNPSLRADTGLNSKESRQRDPYGIFNEEECVPRDIGPYKNLVIFTACSMDPKCLSSPSSVPLMRKLRLMMSNLQNVDLRGLSYQQKLAFWINMYNACIMHGFLQFGVPSTPEKLLTLINKAILNIGGNIINAEAIEHYILRKSTPSKEGKKTGEKEDKESVVRKLYGLETTEPNTTFALCCGTRSSPAVRVYTADSVVIELERSKLEYLQASVMVTSSKKILLPELLMRNTLDFAEDKELLAEWVCHQLPTSGSLRKSIVDCFRTSHNTGTNNNNSRIITGATVEKIPYDYEFQYLLAI